MNKKDILRGDKVIINGVRHRYYENPYKKIEEQQETINILVKRVKSLEESEQFYKCKTVELLVKLEPIYKMRPSQIRR